MKAKNIKLRIECETCLSKDEMDFVEIDVIKGMLNYFPDFFSIEHIPIYIKFDKNEIFEHSVVLEGNKLVFNFKNINIDFPSVWGELLVAIVEYKRRSVGIDTNLLLDALFVKSLCYLISSAYLPLNTILLPKINYFSLGEEFYFLDEKSCVSQTRWVDGDCESSENADLEIFVDAQRRFFLDYPGSNVFTSLTLPSELLLPYLVKCYRYPDKKFDVSIRTDPSGGGDYKRKANFFWGEYFLESYSYKKLVALTFDDGPFPGYTERILKKLNEHQVNATFFLVGERVYNYPNLVSEINNAGHQIANHSWNHIDSETYSCNETLWKHQVEITNQVIAMNIGYKPLFFRPPFGSIKDSQISYLAKKGMKIVNWSIDPNDWDTCNTTSKDVSYLVNKHIGEGVIILLHDSNENGVNALDEIILTYKDKGYSFVTIEELLGMGKAL